MRGTLYIKSTSGSVLFEGQVKSFEAACKIAQAIEDGCAIYHIDLFRSSFQYGNAQMTLDVTERV